MYHTQDQFVDFKATVASFQVAMPMGDKTEKNKNKTQREMPTKKKREVVINDEFTYCN